ncbi:MAG: hypothetical protein JXA11_14145 [Phycisphaerae bacterium]|nr:hypothetical protein [Phycisphaerae bacterium]
MIFHKKTWPWVVSILLHVALLAGIGLWALDRYEKEGDAAKGGGGSGSAVQEPTAADVKRDMEYHNQRVAKLSGEEKLRELQERLDDLDAVSFRNVKGAAGFVESVAGVKRDRWYRPNPSATGTFQSDSATLYDITQRVKDGKTIYEYTLVDAEGRTVKADIPARQMTPDQLRAFTVFEISRRNPKLRYLIDTALKIGENMVREDDGRKGAGDPALRSRYAGRSRVGLGPE